MIVREDAQHFICIEQNHHAHLAKALLQPWFKGYLQDDVLQASVLYAIEQHDVGWELFDQEPLWNDKKQAPYTFIDFPLLIKTVLYTKGVDLVEEVNPYAAALCSKHYTKFLEKYDLAEVQAYVKKEALRRKRIISAFPEVTEDRFHYHLGLLQLADNMSLFLCLHEGGNNEERHRYFQKGIPIPAPVDIKEQTAMKVHWQDSCTLEIEALHKVEPFTLILKEKHLPKKQIAAEGLQETYKQVPYQARKITVLSR